MRLAEVTKEVPNYLNEVSERYQVPQRLRMAQDMARNGAEQAYRMALNHPRTSATAGVILAAAIVGGVLWYIFGGQSEEQQRRPRRVRAGTGRKRARTTRSSRATA